MSIRTSGQLNVATMFNKESSKERQGHITDVLWGTSIYTRHAAEYIALRIDVRSAMERPGS